MTNYEQQLKEFSHAYALGFILMGILIFILGLGVGSYITYKGAEKIIDEANNRPVCDVRLVEQRI